MDTCQWTEGWKLVARDFRARGGIFGVFVQNIVHPRAEYPQGSQLEPESTTLTSGYRRRPRARSTIPPPASHSTPSSSRRVGARIPPAPELHPDIYPSLHSTPCPRAPSQYRVAVLEIHIQPPSSGCPLDIQPSSSPIPALLLPGPHLRLPPLLHLLLPGLHLWAPAAAGPAAIGPATAGPAAMGPAAAGDPSPSSCAPLEASRRHALSVIQARKRDGEEGASAGMMVRQPQRRKAIPIARQHYFRHLANWCTWT
ncbi:uncharacterized protein [Triticum aestivum]|uniref:uncharacterized protein n=1 Tax=Triticum aestivum TaxID=4565 RepID=UPI001D020184|nr:uncharacterized protein LOC123170996 [Triticum aestivum]